MYGQSTGRSLARSVERACVTGGMVVALSASAGLLGGCEESATKDPSASDAGAVVDLDAAVMDCGEPPSSTKAFTRARLLDAAAQCASWHYCEFNASAAALRERTHAYAKDRNEENLEAAREAFRESMAAWSKAELFQYGPAASATQDEYHGKGLRSLIYAWPNTSRCRVEEQIVSRAYEKDFSKVLINGRGLFAVEYGLFYEGDDHACLASSATAKAWPSFDEDELASRKADYASAAATDALAQAQGLVRLWSASGGNFSETLASASGYPNEQEALNVVAFGLVYLEKEVKDWKLGLPAGVTTMAPVTGPETPFAQLGTENIRNNLRGFRALFQGCGSEGKGIGFDDWLVSAGHEGLAQDTIAALDNAQAAADAFPPLHEASQDQIKALYDAIKALTDLLKADLFGPGSPINLKPPASIEGDTD